MASHKELQFDWSMLCAECSQWTDSDLQLAAELGKTLLERNKELEGSLKHQQNVIEDQIQEIEYLTKQTVALREVNDSRLRIYENLEVSIQDLERGNHRLTIENASIKKQNKTLTTNIEHMESKCEELSRQIDDLNRQIKDERRLAEKKIQERCRENELQRNELNTSGNSVDQTPSKHHHYSHIELSESIDNIDGMRFVEHCNVLPTTDDDDILRIINELDTTKRQYNSEQQRVSELEEQLISLIQENQGLQNRLVESNSNEEMKSMHDELSILEDVRQGKMCSRCMRSCVDDTLEVSSQLLNDDESSIVDTEDGETNSYLESKAFRKSVTVKDELLPSTRDESQDVSPLSNPNPYRELVEKYEALLEVQRLSMMRTRPIVGNYSPARDDQPTSSEFSSMNTKDGGDYDDIKMNKIKSVKSIIRRNVSLVTPTDFSEAETSSSGFSDETSNKCTQTEETFLCMIADGEDKFSIYDEASTSIDSRFRNRPEYRALFKEIFGILKKAAENKDDGEQLPLLDDANPLCKVPPVTPATEELPPFPDDSASVISSIISEQSIAMSERVTKQERKNITDLSKKLSSQDNQVIKQNVRTVGDNERVLTPYKRQPLEYLAMTGNLRKKNKKKSKSGQDRSDSPILPTPPIMFYSSSPNSKKRKDLRLLSTSTSNNRSVPSNWNRPSVEHAQPVSSSMTSSPPFNPQSHGTTIKRNSTASQNLHKLIKLDLSYAEVLRRGAQCSSQLHQQHNHQVHHK